MEEEKTIIIDSHTHLGFETFINLDINENVLIDSMDKAGVDISVVMPMQSDINPISSHDRIARFCIDNPGRAYGMVSINPIFCGLKNTLKEIERCIIKLNFVAVKINPCEWGFSPTSYLAEEIIKKAEELDIPVMIHTGGHAFATPGYVGVAASRHPNVTFIMAHAGGGFWESWEAAEIAKEHINIFVDATANDVRAMKYIVSGIGASRCLFASDDPRDSKTFIFITRQVINDLGLSHQEAQQIFSENAISVYKLKI